MRRRPFRRPAPFRLLLAALLAGAAAALGAAPPRAAAPPRCAQGNGGITLPRGFCAVVVADSLEGPRHLAVAPNGDLYVALVGRRGQGGGIVALRDTTDDGRADVVRRFGTVGGTGLALRGNHLYFAPNGAVLRYTISADALAPTAPPDTIVAGLPAQHGHTMKAIVLGPDDALYVNVGSPSNSCQAADRELRSPGHDPCTQLETRAGIWRFHADRTGQTQADGVRFATGIRNAVGLTIGGDGALWATQHGRDQLFQSWPSLYNARQGAELPSEELLRVTRGADFGWPYCYHDWHKGHLVLAPEYGGNGTRVGRCADKQEPVVAFPGHWAPDGLLYYRGDAFPEHYRGGFFIAFHGSWNRAPEPQAGYKVVFVPMHGNRPGRYETFADGFAGASVQPGTAAHRPTGLAEGPDGSLYVSDDLGGRIWRIMPLPEER